eukprot:4241068-Prymnesium_polylepis.1
MAAGRSRQGPARAARGRGSRRQRIGSRAPSRVRRPPGAAGRGACRGKAELHTRAASPRSGRAALRAHATSGVDPDLF